MSQPITASLGVASFPQHAIDGDTLMRSADRALYTSKRSGRDRVTTAHSPADSAEALTALPTT